MTPRNVRNSGFWPRSKRKSYGERMAECQQASVHPVKNKRKASSQERPRPQASAASIVANEAPKSIGRGGRATSPHKMPLINKHATGSSGRFIIQAATRQRRQ